MPEEELPFVVQAAIREANATGRDVTVRLFGARREFEVWPGDTEESMTELLPQLKLRP
ncbi:hypothetical protein NE236_09925 [Actinoallomurus purpureus]|uniref:hypothetical protein n=1 Tax=Actinoallomurus purpureus TaxID=478114 RepID=UPI002092BAB5|nr:hypothetical protein [Actinoallomurus purpureus]MCO6005304.1 hypothetical protein [Actinoallomurus purpureus]